MTGRRGLFQPHLLPTAVTYAIGGQIRQVQEAKFTTTSYVVLGLVSMRR